MEAEVPRLRSSRSAQVADRARIRADRARARADLAADLAKTRARQTAAEIAPLAKSAGEAVRHGADEVAAWAGPQVRKTRSWAAPQLERTGVLVQEKLAPQVSEALTKAARKVDPAPSRRRRGLRRFLAIGLAAAGAAVAVMVVRKKTGSSVSQPDFTGADEPDSGPVTPPPADATATDPAETSRVDANGHIRSTP
jgi:hypothetical protein